MARGRMTQRQEQRTAGMPRVARNGGVSQDWWLGDSPVATPWVQDPSKAGREGSRRKGVDAGGALDRDGGSAGAMPFAWGEDG